jgi:hypothetical protein
MQTDANDIQLYSTARIIAFSNFNVNLTYHSRKSFKINISDPINFKLLLLLLLLLFLGRVVEWDGKIQLLDFSINQNVLFKFRSNL